MSIRRVPLRIEAYDPFAKDGDGDGIVQDGTAWERPVGTRILDELGREIARGHTSAFRPKNLRYVDKHGKDVNYTPKHESPEPKPTTSRTALERIGHPSLGRRGSPIGSKQPGLSDLGHASIIDRHDPPKPPSPGKIEKPKTPVAPSGKVTAAHQGVEAALELWRNHWQELVALEHRDPNSLDEANRFLKGEADKVLERIAELQGGFDGLPVPVSAEEVRALEAAGAERVFRALDQPEFIQALRSGENRFGTGMWGSGIYTSPNVDWVQDFTNVKLAGTTNIANNYAMFYLDPNARIISVAELRDIQRELRGRFVSEVPELAAIMDRHRNSPPRTPEERAEFQQAFIASELLSDYGRLAALLGYDAIEVRVGKDQRQPEKKRALGRNHEIVILNRTALRLPPQPGDVEWREIARAAHGERLAERTARLDLPTGAPHPPLHLGVDEAIVFLEQRGKDIEAKIDPDLTPNDAFFGKPDLALLEIVKLQGFDGLPIPVSAKEAEALEAAGAPVVYRALDDAEHARDLRGGVYWPGTGIHGAGVYVAPNADVVGDYTTVELAAHPNPGAHWTRLLIHPAARIISIDDLRKELATLKSEFEKAHFETALARWEAVERNRANLIAAGRGAQPAMPRPKRQPTELRVFEDYGRVAALLGYDVISAGEGADAEYVVVNRSALVLPPQPSRAEWRRIGKEARAAANAAVDSTGN